MNDFELKSKLKSVPLPARTPEYWENFPAQVRASLHRAPGEFAPRNFWLPRLAWSGGFALAGLIFTLSLWPSVHVLLQKEKTFRWELAQLSKHLCTFMQDEHGLHYLVAEKE
jgi:hypothetical protein